jgi:microcystin-dependent protein
MTLPPEIGKESGLLIRRLSRRALLSLVGVFSLIPLAARAACTSPAGATNATELGASGILYTCDGTNWNVTIMPAGAIVPYAGSSAPSGWLLCYGQLVSTTTYANLYTALGTTYGSGSGTFGIPDLRGRAAFGVDNMGGSTASRVTSGGSGITGTTLGAAGGAETVTLSTAQLPAHNHSASDSGHSHGISDPGHTHNSNNGANFVSDGGGYGLNNGPYCGLIYGLTTSATGIGINTGTT